MYDSNKLSTEHLKIVTKGQNNKEKSPSSSNLLNKLTIENLTKQLNGLFNKLGEIRDQIQEVKPQTDTQTDNADLSSGAKKMLDDYNAFKMLSKFTEMMGNFNTYNRLKESENKLVESINDVMGRLGKTEDVDSTGSKPVISSDSNTPVKQSDENQEEQAPLSPEYEPGQSPEEGSGFGPAEFKFKNSSDKEHIENEQLENGVKEAGGKILEKSNTQVSQFAGESNTNGISKELGINGNCAVCALVSGARSLGAMKGDESTAQDDISHVRELMKPGSNHFQGTKPADIIRGAKKLGLNANMYKGNADDLIKELDKGNVPIASVNAKEYGVFKKKKEKVGHGVAVTDYDPKTNSFTVNDSLLDKPITVTKENMNRAMSSSHFKNSIISLSKGDKNSIVKNEKGNPETEESVKKSHGFSKPSNDSSSVSDSRSKAPDKNYNNAPIDLGTKEGPSLMPTYDPKRAFPRMLETSSASAVNKSKDPTMILKNGARFSEENDLNHVSQYKNSANPNAESPNNANSVPASLVTASRNLGRMDNSKGSSTANSQIKSARGLMNPGSNDYAGNHPRHIMNGAKKMGLYTMPTKGNSKNMINLIKERMQHGDQIMAFVNSNAYSEGASDNAHSVVVKDFVTKSKQYDPLAKNEENLDAGTPKEYAVLHDPRFEKPIEVPVEKFQEAMDTVPINGFRNSFIRLNKDPLKLNGPLIVVGDTIVRDTNGVISPSLQKELGLKRPK